MVVYITVHCVYVMFKDIMQGDRCEIHQHSSLTLHSYPHVVIFHARGGATITLQVSVHILQVFRMISPSIQRVQVLADILHSTLCCHSNESRAPIANLPVVHN